MHVGIESQQQCGTFLDNTDASVPVAVHTAFMAFGLSEPALQIEVILREVGIVTSHKKARLKVCHHTAHVLARRVIAALELLPQGLKLGVTLGTWATVRRKRVLDRPHVGHVVAYGLVRIVHRRQTSVDVAGQTRQSFMSWPPFCTSRFRCRDARTSSRASAMRKPGGCNGPP